MTTSNGLEIAVIGMAGRFPGARDTDDFWRLLKEGREGFTVFTDEALRQAGVPQALLEHPNYVRRNGVIERKNAFDAELFGYNRADAAVMDPQLRVFHEVVWEALEQAGYQSDKFDGAIGLYAGASSNLRWRHRMLATAASLADHYNMATVTDTSYLSTRVAHRLNLTGPALSANTTCSTSLVNIHLGCQALLTGECDIAVAGGVSITSIENTGYLYEEGMILSRDGACRPFDADADGTAAGEGCGVLVLKRLDDALAANDNVLAVIKASAINNDGMRKVGFTAPSVDGQAGVLRQALDKAQVDPATIGYIEAHGTATKLGDPIEISALTQVFGARAAPQSIAIGSVKSNIGHLGEAAGVAGAIKTILALRHRQLPPSLHYRRANPMLGIERTPFHVNDRLTDWHAAPGVPRRAGVSSFGIGGTNAHLVLEEAPPAPAGGPAHAHHMVFLSAATPSALAALEQRLRAHAAGHPQASLADLCHTLHVGRKDLAYRSAHVAAGMAALAAPARRHAGKVDDTPARLYFLFPGQGTQYRGMGHDLYRRIPFFRARLDECFAIARRHSDIDFGALLYPDHGPAGGAANDGAGLDLDLEHDAPLTRTDAVQPLLFMFEYALARTLQHWGYAPQACVGHSVGEYVAACLAGVFTPEDAIAVVIGRARLVQRLPAGAMLAVSVSEAEIMPRLASGLSLAAVNAPRRVVVSGDIDAVERLRAQLAAEGVPATVLRTSHAFHSHHLDPVLDEFRALLSTVAMGAPALPFLSNVTGTWIRAGEATSPDYWVRHLRGTVRFGDCLAALDGARQLLVEAGPGAVLSAFVAQGGVAGRVAVALLPGEKHGAQTAADAALFDGLCQLFVHGARPDWARFYEDQQRRRVALPAYPFEGTAFVYGPEPLLAAAGQPAPAAAPGPSAPAPHAAPPEPAPGADAQADADGSVAARLTVIWRKYLGNDAIGPHDDLLSFGVDSLLSIRVITAIRETFDTEIMLDTIFVLRTIAEQADEIERKLGGAGAAAMPAIAAGAHGGVAPLSSSQRRLWIISQLERGHTAYNTGTCVFVKGMDVALIERAFRAIIARHSILRTTYAEVDGEPRQHVHERFDFDVARLDISAMAAPERYRHATALWQAELLKPIDLGRDLMLRVAAARYDDETHFVMITLHHICSDNWTINLLMDELRRLCEAYQAGRDDPLAPLPVQYIDYVLWQNAWLEQGVAARQLPYWTNKLAGIPQVHNLPLDHPRPKFQSYLGTQLYTRIDAGVLAGLNRLGQAHGTTLFMTMQAAFAVLMARYSGENDIVVGFPVANRLHTEVESLIGFFVNTLVLRSDLADNPRFADFLDSTKAALLEAYAHPHLPFEMLVGELNPQRSLSYEPIAQVQLIFLDQSETSGGRFDAAGPRDAEVIRFGDMPVPFSKYDLSLYFSVVDGGLSLAWEYATALFEPATIARMADNFELLLRNVARMPERRVRELPLLSDAELERQYANAARDGADTPAARFVAALRAPPAAAGAIDFSLFYFATDAAARADDKYKLMFDGARYADAHGFHAVWTPERHFGSFGGIYPNPAITAAALAAVTSNVRIRAGSCVLPLHDPVRVAEDWSVIDNISGGRVGIGFAAGYAPNDFTLAPDNFAARREILTRDVRTVKALWRGEAIARPNGLGEMTRIEIRPRPLQPTLPVWVTTTGNVEAFRHAGRMGDNVLTHLMGQSLAALADKVGAYRDEWRAAGHAGDGIVTLLAHTFIAADEALIFEHVKDPFKRYLVESVGTPQAGGAARDSDVETLSERAFQRYYRSNALLGTPERCLPLVRDIQAAGVNEIACLIDFGVDPALVLENLPNLDRLRRLAQPTPAPAAPAPAAPPCVHTLFARRAALAPDAVALELDGRALRYAQLDARSNRLANHLLARHGVRPQERVGLCMEPGFAMIVGMLAILKAGACYVPIEPSLPAARIAYMVRDAGLGVALVSAPGQHGLDGVATLVLDDGDEGHGDGDDDGDGDVDGDADRAGAGWRAASAAAPGVDVAPADLAYVMYTSGSTGEPKGVMVEHAQLSQLFGALPARLGVTADDVWAQCHSFTFDVSVWEIWGALAHGGRLVLVPKAARQDLRALHRLLAGRGVTVLNQTPSAFYALQSLIPAGRHGLALRQVHLAGEALQPKQLAQWFAPGAGPAPLFVNLYGPTETTVFATFKEIGEADLASDRSNIGRPLPGVAACVLNAAGLPQPVGVAGELYLQGGGVARGYLNRAELTARAFVTAPFAGAPGRWYRTGDLVRWLPNGDLEYLARADQQVKVRGYRIELGEIENCLVAHPQVGEAAVLALGDGAGRYLAACVVPAGGAEPATLVAELKRTLTDALPYYMVPQAFALIEHMPRNANGKLDTAALARLALAPAAALHVAPRTEVERALAAIWGRLLGREGIGVTAGFFELGGQSLVAIRVVNAIAQRFGIDLETRVIFEYNTIEALADFIEAGLWRRRSAAAAAAGPAADEEEFSL